MGIGVFKLEKICHFGSFGVASIGDKLIETYFKWFGHVSYMSITMSLGKSSSIQVDSQLNKMGRLKKEVRYKEVQPIE